MPSADALMRSSKTDDENTKGATAKREAPLGSKEARIQEAPTRKATFYTLLSAFYFASLHSTSLHSVRLLHHTSLPTSPQKRSFRSKLRHQLVSVSSSPLRRAATHPSSVYPSLRLPPDTHRE
eukprot:scaffold8593_cov248-Pinguiococcus_pyrenoidosus.AAC.2